MNAYTLVLALHGLLRWAALGLLVVVLVRSVLAWRSGEGWTASHDKAHVALVVTTDVQLILGLVLYAGLSPLSSAFFADAKHAMKVPGLRFFAVEHVVGMLIAVALVHIGRVRSKRAPSGLRHRRVVTWVAVALFVMLGSIPWPGSRTHGRPLLRGLSSTTPAADVENRASRLSLARPDARSRPRPLGGAPRPTTYG